MTDKPGAGGAADQPTGQADGDSLADLIAESSRRLELADPDPGSGFLDRAVNRCVEAAGALVLCTIVGTVFANAVSRYVLDASLIWVEELVLLLVPWLAMTGVFLAVRRGTTIRIEFFFEKLPPGVRRWIADSGYLINIAVLGFMGWVSLDYFRLFGRDPTPYLEVATGWSSSALAFGAFGAALAFALEWRRERRRTRHAG